MRLHCPHPDASPSGVLMAWWVFVAGWMAVPTEFDLHLHLCSMGMTDEIPGAQVIILLLRVGVGCSFPGEVYLLLHPLTRVCDLWGQ